MVMNVDLTVILCIPYIAVIYNSNRDSRMEKLKMIGIRRLF